MCESIFVGGMFILIVKRMVCLKYPITLISKLDSGLRVCPDNIFS